MDPRPRRVCLARLVTDDRCGCRCGQKHSREPLASWPRRRQVLLDLSEVLESQCLGEVCHQDCHKPPYW